ncbi:MAG: trypsin-like peptidase domain-containing protein [Geodermatophilaceae bacterium]|nr:trypsin-like peptidase domain-containing protein [Geodermatophilaceae bacterium]MDQ3455346.1 trypsin-like peptidase domain-containing protein [Actinomycetota bacterium]
MASSTKPRKSTTRRRSTAESAAPANTAFDNALYPPRLDTMAFTEAVDNGAGPEYSVILESICGVSDDSQPVEQYDGSLGVTTGFVDVHQLPVAQVAWNADLGSVFTNPGDVNGVRWGSGTMIGPDLFLTCGHLFDQDPNGWTIPRQNGTSTAISPQQVAQNMHLNFEYQVDGSGVLRAEQQFPITQLIEYRLGGLDMALCRVGGNPGSIYGFTEVATSNAAVGDMIAIIGHPAGQPKRIEAGPLTQVSGSTVRYNDIDTLGGNSGSGIAQSPSGAVIGVHTNGGCNSAGTGSNSGVAIAAIRAVSPTLQALPSGSQTAQAADSFATKLALDLHHTLHASDTIHALDNLGTPLADDLLGTVKAADTGLFDVLGTKLAGDFGTSLAGDFGTFGSGDDPNLTKVEHIFDPSSILFDPVVLRGVVAAAAHRPFVQAGPFTPVGGESAEASVGEALMAQLAEVIAAQAAVLTALQAVHGTLAALSTASA